MSEFIKNVMFEIKYPSSELQKIETEMKRHQSVNNIMIDIINDTFSGRKTEHKPNQK